MPIRNPIRKSSWPISPVPELRRESPMPLPKLLAVSCTGLLRLRPTPRQNNKASRSSVEMADETSRPALGGETLNLQDYDVVFLGYPIWWDLCPRPVNTFLEKYDFSGKTIIPFATSGGSSITGSVKQLRSYILKLNGRLAGCVMEAQSRPEIGQNRLPMPNRIPLLRENPLNRVPVSGRLVMTPAI